MKLTDLIEFMTMYETITLLHMNKPYFLKDDLLVIGYTGIYGPEYPRHNTLKYKAQLGIATKCVNLSKAAHFKGMKTIVTTHYPPSLEERSIFQQLQPSYWLHGHAHRGGDDEDIVRKHAKERNGPKQICISCDYLDMIPLLLEF